MDPPLCVQNAMMTKDKKPFTYTPGGIDLSEVRSPRMARRIERNANLAGVGEAPRPQSQQPQNYNNLPPSTLAAMRPQPQVQVFPSGPPPPPPMKGKIPPPPPMNAPPPPPPPTCALPTQKVKTSDNQVLERPDMTKIIPEDPMKLLRKTGGPQPRKSIVDQMFEEAHGGAGPIPRTPPSPPQKITQYDQQPRFQSSQLDRGAPISPVPQQQQYQQPSPPFRPQPQQYQPQVQQQQSSSPQYQPLGQQFQPQSPQTPPETNRYQPPVIERQPSMKTERNTDPEIKTSTAHLGSLYIPPSNQQQQRKVVSPPSPPERNTDSPGLQTPPLKEAPKPWQSKKPQQEEIPPWAKRNNESEENSPSPSVQPPQQRWPQSKPVQQNQGPQPSYNQQPYHNQNQPSPQTSSKQQPIGVRIEIRTNYPQYEEPEQEEEEERHPNAVYVTQPMVFQHPGPRVLVEPKQKPKPKVDSQGARVVPIQVERGPGTPSAERSLNRQQSWSSNPTQSNSFKVIQKLTQTDNDDDDIDYDAPMTEHPPTFPQNFQQPADQLGRMKISDDGHNMMNRFNQVPRGPSVQNNAGPRVRTIPIQIEDDVSPKPYVHPSQQTVPEPKKYTGSSIPSRSFKILQAMTAPENNASADEENDATLYDQWGFGPYYPPYPPPPYWHDYYHNYYYPDPPNSEFSNMETDSISKNPSRQNQLSPSNSSCGRQTPSSGRQTPVFRTRTPIQGRQTPTPGRTTPSSRQSFPPRPSPVPYWGYLPPPFPYPLPKKSVVVDDSDSESITRSTIPPHWNYHSQSTEEIEEDYNDAHGYPPYPYFDPYYYYYGYPYPPVYPPYPYYGATDSEDYAGYSSTDEMAFYNRNSMNNSQSSIISNKKEEVNPTLNIKEQVCKIEVTEPESDQEKEQSETNSDVVQTGSVLKSIKSVSNINVYYDGVESEEEVESAEENSEETNGDSEDDESLNNEDGYPHQLSVIFEESERTESRLRSVSVMSDATTIANKSDDEDEIVTDVYLQSKKIAIASDIEKEVEENCENTEVYASFTLKSPSVTPKKTSPCRFDEEDKDTRECSVNNEAEIHCPSAKEEEMEKNESVDEGKESDESEDWWGILGGEDDLPKPRVSIINESEKDTEISDQNTESVIVPTDLDSENNSHGEAHEDIDQDREDHCSNIESGAADVKKITRRFESMTDTNLNNDTKKEAIISSKKIDLDNVEYKKRSIYDDSDEDETTGTLIEMGSFVEQLEQIQKQAGLWKANLKCIELKQTTNQTSEIINKEADLEVTQSLINSSETQQCSEETESDNVWCKDKDANKMTVPYCRKEESFESGYSASYTEYSCSSSKSDIASHHLKETNETDAYNATYHKKVPKLTKQAEIDNAEESSDGTASSSEDEENNNGTNDENNNENEVKVLSVKERIQSLRECIRQKQAKYEEHETKTSVKERITALEINNPNRSKTTSTKSSLKSFEEYSEEEDFDSGVTSDMSRHISDNEEFPELRKLTKYQRAATHSRLFKLLQEGCDSDDEEKTSNNTDMNKTETTQMNKRDHLTLPLRKSPDELSACSSGLSSPNCQVNEKLVEELVQSLLRRKKGQIFRNIPKEKLYAAATRIIQEDFGDELESQEDCNSFLSPLRCSTGYSTAAQTPQEFNSSFDEYNQYYDSWREAKNLNDETCYDVLPSKIFKELTKTGSIAGLLVKCPRVLSSKNIHKKLMKLLESSESNSPNPEKSLDTNEVTTAS